jgi:flagellar secretion chaperone FliS
VNRLSGAEAYRRVEAESRSPLELVVMLYDGALRFLGDAREASKRSDRRGRATGISKTMAIVAELQSTLNLEAGGTVAQELDRLYTYITVRLVDASVKRDDAAIDEVRKLMTGVRASWADIANGAGARP